MIIKQDLYWNTHCVDAFSIFNQFRNTGTLVDITLCCEGQVLKAHKVILCALSDYFKDFLQNDTNPNPIICFSGVSMNVLKSLIDFLYTGEVEIHPQYMRQFLEFAETLEIKGFKMKQPESLAVGLSAKVSPIYNVPKRKDSIIQDGQEVYAKKTMNQPQQKRVSVIVKTPHGRKEAFSDHFQMASVAFQTELELAVGPSDLMLKKEPLNTHVQDPPLQLQQVNHMDKELDEEKQFLTIQNLDVAPQPSPVGINLKKPGVLQIMPHPRRVPHDNNQVSRVDRYIWSRRSSIEGASDVYFCVLCPFTSYLQSEVKSHMVVHIEGSHRRRRVSLEKKKGP